MSLIAQKQNNVSNDRDFLSTQATNADTADLDTRIRPSFLIHLCNMIRVSKDDESGGGGENENKKTWETSTTAGFRL